MSFSKIAQIALYIVAGISVLVIGFFYFGENLIDVAAYEAKVEKLNAPDDTAFDYMQADVSEEVDSLIAEDPTTLETGSEEVVADSVVAEMEEELPVVAEEITKPEKEIVKLSFMERLVHSRTDIAIVWAYILIAITLLVVVGFSMHQMVSNTRALIRGLIALVVVAVLVGIAYMLGSDVPIDIVGYDGTDNSDPKVLKMVDMGLLTTYFVLGSVLISVIYSEISKYFK